MPSAPFRLDRAFIRVAGADARTLLQGLLTQDLDQLTPGRALYAALLSPQGKIITDMLLWDKDGAVLIETDRARAADLARRLMMYRLRAQATIDDVSETWAAVLSFEPAPGFCADPRMPDGALGYRQALSAHAAQSFADGEQELFAKRITLGVPDLAHDCAAEEIFALEGLLEELHGVDFQKGCFVGQENVSRMKRRATTRKKFCPIAFEGAAPTPGAPVMAGEVELGQVRGGAAGRALTLLRLDRALAAEANGVGLTVEGRQVRLAPPGWLILPARDGAEA